MYKKVIDFAAIRLAKANEAKNIPEIIQRSRFIQDISNGKFLDTTTLSSTISRRETSGTIPNDQLRTAIDAGILTFLLHWYVLTSCLKP